MHAEWKTEFKSIQVGTARKLRNGENVAILSFGHVGNYATEVCNEYDKEGCILDTTIQDLPSHLIKKYFTRSFKIMIISSLSKTDVFPVEWDLLLLSLWQITNTILVYRLGIPDEFIEHGPQAQLHADCGYDKKSLKIK